MALRDCDDCEKHWYDERTGEVRRDAFGLPVLRPPGTKPPCPACEKVPKEVRRNTHPGKVNKSLAVNLTPANQQAYDHYLECRAVGRFPDDEIVKRHASIIRQLEDARDRLEEAERFGALAAALGLIRRR